MSRYFYAETIRMVREKIAQNDLGGAVDILKNEHINWEIGINEHKKALYGLIKAVKAYEAHVEGAVRTLSYAKLQVPELKENNLSNCETQLQYIAEYGKEIVEAAEKITKLCKKEELEGW